MLRHTRLHSDSLVQNAIQETEEKLNWYGTATTMFTNIRVTPGNDPTGQYELSVLVFLLDFCSSKKQAGRRWIMGG